MSAWAAFYKTRTGPGYFEYAKLRYAPFIATVTCHARVARRVLEIGAGLGTVTAAVMEQAPRAQYHVSDNDPVMLAFLGRRFLPSATVWEEDAREPGAVAADLVHSHGLLEHFSDADIIRIVEGQRHATQVHYVPGLYPAPSFGDERLLPLDHWRDLVRPDAAFAFNDGLDYCLVRYGRR